MTRNEYRRPDQKFYLRRLGKPIKQRYLDPVQQEKARLKYLAERKRFRRWCIHEGVYPRLTPRSRP